MPYGEALERSKKILEKNENLHKNSTDLQIQLSRRDRGRVINANVYAPQNAVQIT